LGIRIVDPCRSWIGIFALRARISAYVSFAAGCVSENENGIWFACESENETFGEILLVVWAVLVLVLVAVKMVRVNHNHNLAFCPDIGLDLYLDIDLRDAR
jgi:hypothetical protein